MNLVGQPTLAAKPLGQPGSGLLAVIEVQRPLRDRAAAGSSQIGKLGVFRARNTQQ
jgi:hypothetical protein